MCYLNACFLLSIPTAVFIGNYFFINIAFCRVVHSSEFKTRERGSVSCAEKQSERNRNIANTPSTNYVPCALGNVCLERVISVYLFIPPTLTLIIH